MIRGISDRSAFARLRAEGQQVRSRHLRLRWVGSQGSSEPDESLVADIRVAYVITRRVGNAVVRNRIRRRIRGALEELSNEGVSPPPGFSLFLVDPATRDVGYQRLKQEVSEVIQALEKLRVEAS